MGIPNPEVLRWARESAGLSYEDAARKLQMSGRSAVKTLKAFEEGGKTPSRSKLLMMSKQYHRSYLTFFLSRPPSRVERGEDFRTLPESEANQFSGVLDALVRDIFVRQELVKEALIETEEDEVISFVGAGAEMPEVVSAASVIQEWLELETPVFRGFGKPHDAFNYLRSLVEKKGIYVLLIGDLGHYRSQVSTEVFRGFALSDPIAPFVVVNNYDAKTAWSFTLLHELVHIWLGKTGVSAQISDNKVERYCNDVASQILVNEQEIAEFFQSIDQEDRDILADVSRFTASNNVSGSLVIYRLFRSGFITEAVWKDLQEELRQHWLEARRREKAKKKAQESSSGNYYATQRHKVGSGLLSVVRRSVGEGVLTETKAGKVLGVSSGSVTAMLGV
ncbi:ImmA/IrrE family metallo-endopeptidase [Marinobacter subterrani]|uniref:ImmA/IrrE family metallo-endopeptidase n=1 Tax=Marinobacter subterrani TaxID=1658765 RepID=UPI0023523FFD|nr:ImmA/IrrE family metallo-endopeptidase [Marinobacter subterrani]